MQTGAFIQRYKYIELQPEAAIVRRCSTASPQAFPSPASQSYDSSFDELRKRAAGHRRDPRHVDLPGGQSLLSLDEGRNAREIGESVFPRAPGLSSLFFLFFCLARARDAEQGRDRSSTCAKYSGSVGFSKPGIPGAWGWG
jgi:hypothetical protein